MEYKEIKWREGSRFSVDAKIASVELDRIRDKQDGELRPADVVAEASKKRNPLHPEFDWDDESAANKYREDRARTMIRSIVVIRKEAPKVVARKYEATYSRETREEGQPQKQCYRTTEEILSDPIERDRLLARAIKELGAFRERYAGLSELAVVFQAAEDAIKKAL